MRQTVFAVVVAMLLATTSGSAQQKTLVIDKVVVNRTPQSGTWLMCFTAQSGEIENTFHHPDETYSGDGITIRMNLELGPVSTGDRVDFLMNLDDDEADVCSNSAEDKSADTLVAGVGSKRVIRDNFNYIVYYHMK